jgi:hypothetical protein
VLTFISPVLVGPKRTQVFLNLNLNNEQLRLRTYYRKNPCGGFPKPSVASSDEKRLTVGISTIGLQSKRLSGAQRKRLTGETKMRERTWTEREPPGKTPSSQDRSVAGSGGGVGRPHSYSSTPPLEKQQRKNPGTLKCRLGRIRKL